MTTRRSIEHIRSTAVCTIATTLLLINVLLLPSLHGAEQPEIATNKISAPLMKKMNEDPGHIYSILATLKPRVSEEEKRKLFQQIAQTNQTNHAQIIQLRRLALTERLRAVASTSQAPVLVYLRNLDTNLVSGIRPLWLANAIGLKAPRTVIETLASSNEVASIHLDVAPDDLRQTCANQSWGLGKVKADQVAVTVNQTITVAVIDSGVKTDHPDLAARLWQNPGETGLDSSGHDKSINHIDDDGNGHVDDVSGWDFSGTGDNDPNPNPAEIGYQHGTQVAGIIAGDGTRGTCTGVAPQARIMALRVTSALDEGAQLECLAAMQYALTKVARVVNLSLGWRRTEDPAYAQWRDAVQHLVDLDVVVVTVAGNFGYASGQADNPKPFNVLTPGRVPAAITVGATSNTSNDNLVDSSGIGPVTWQGVVGFDDYPYEPGPGLAKPDLLAPGDDIQTLGFGFSFYSVEDGTSMAAPHVAGVAALLLTQNPNLSAYDVRFILETTAAHNAGTRPHALRGWGRVDAKAALFYQTTKFPFPPQTGGGTGSAAPYDLTVQNVAFDSVNGLLSARVKNLGGQVVGNSEMRFYVFDASTRTTNDLDPNRDGSPADANFTYVGSYFVPIVGPKLTSHKQFDGFVRWTPPNPAQFKWWIGVWVLPGAASVPESNPHNNSAVIRLGP